MKNRSNFLFIYFQIKDKDTTPLLAGKNMGHPDKENHEAKKSTKDSVV
jgi:solute carrier family 35 protein E3